MENLTLAELLETLVAFSATWGLSVLGALAVLIIGRWIAGRVRKGLHEHLDRAGMEPMLIPFAATMVYWGLMTFVMIAVLGLFGVPTASFIAVLGAAGLAVGLALQGTLSNFASGVMILTFRPFQVGDWVEAAGEAGTIQEVGIFSTSLNRGDNVAVTIPNGQIYGETIRNYSRNDTRRIDLVMGVGYEDDLGLARETILGILASDERVLDDPEPLVAVDSLGDSSVNFVVRPWCVTSDYWALRRDLTHRMKVELEAAGCSIPFPQRDVHLHQVA